jgi:triosephosphate isomerase (TIM)
MENQNGTIRKIFIGGNWKCNGDLAFAKSHSEFLNTVEFDTNKCEVAVCPTSIHIGTVKNHINERYIVASQNVSMFDNGAYTGEISAKQLKDMGVNWTLVGHSERRQYFGDTEEVIAKKIAISLQNGVNVIACIGEKLTERENGQTFEVVKSQLQTLINSISDWNKVVIAYEPVWAIGTGKTATKEQAQEVHAEIRKLLKESVNEQTANSVRIIYGGSVTDTNANDLISQIDIDGFLVGGASLKSGFKAIIESYKAKF